MKATVDNIIEWINQSISVHEEIARNTQQTEQRAASSNKAHILTSLLLKINEARLEDALDELPKWRPDKPAQISKVQISPGRRVGNTTRQADILIQELFTHPGQWVAIADHSQHPTGNDYLTRIITDRMHREHRISGASPARSNTQAVPYLEVKASRNSPINYIRLITANDLPKSPDKLRIKQGHGERQPVRDIHPDFTGITTTPIEPSPENIDFSDQKAREEVKQLIQDTKQRDDDRKERGLPFFNPLTLNSLMEKAQRIGDIAASIPPADHETVADKIKREQGESDKRKALQEKISASEAPAHIKDLFLQNILIVEGEPTILIDVSKINFDEVTEWLYKINGETPSQSPALRPEEHSEAPKEEGKTETSKTAGTIPRKNPPAKT